MLRAQINLIQVEMGNIGSPYSRPEKPHLVLISYDQAAIARINEKSYFPGIPKEFVLVCPAKYALILDSEGGDISIKGQMHIQHPDYRKKAIWFDYFKDLPRAINDLQSRNINIKIDPVVNFVIDWPIEHRKYVDGSLVKV